MRKVEKSFVLSFCVLIGLAMIFCGSSLAAQKVNVGINLPLTGPAANDGQMARDGALLALEHSKAKPELGKYDIQMISEDDRSDPKDAAAIANKFAGDPEILAVIGNYNSSCTLAAAPILIKERIVQISPGSSSPKITGFSKYLFRTQPTDQLVGKNIVDWAKELGFKKVAIVYENSDFGKGLQNLYETMCPPAGIEIVANETYLPGSTLDFTSVLTKIKFTGAKAVLMGSLYNEAALMAKQAHQLRLKTVFFGDTSQHTNALIELGKNYVDNWHVVGAMNPKATDQITTRFIADFQKKFGHDPNTFAAQGYDAMLIILDGLAKNGPNRDKLQEHVSSVKGFPGVTGKLTFRDGDVEKQLFRFVVEKGKFKQVVK